MERVEPDRLQRPFRAHGLAPLCAAARGQPAAGDPERRRRGSRRGGGRRAPGRQPAHVVRGPGRSGELAAQFVRLALQPAGLERQGPRVLPQAPARHPARRAGQGARPGGRAKAGRGRLARRGAGGQARSAGDSRFSHVDHLPLLRRRAADGDLVREERPQHVGHAPLHPPAVGRRRPGVGDPQRLGDFQGHREEILRGRGWRARRRARPGAGADPARHAGGARPGDRGQGLEAGRVRPRARQDHAQHGGRRARLPLHLQEVHRARAADDRGRQRRQGHQPGTPRTRSRSSSG